MNRRTFLRRTVCVGVAAVAMPYVSRSHFRDIVAWLGRAWPRERWPVSSRVEWLNSPVPVIPAPDVREIQMTWTLIHKRFTSSPGPKHIGGAAFA